MLNIIKFVNISIFGKNKNNNKIVRYDNYRNKKFVEKSEKLKAQKMFKFKKLSKSRNFSKNNIIKKSSFLTFNTRIIFNGLQLNFIKALIF